MPAAFHKSRSFHAGPTRISHRAICPTGLRARAVAAAPAIARALITAAIVPPGICPTNRLSKNACGDEKFLDANRQVFKSTALECGPGAIARKMPYSA